MGAQPWHEPQTSRGSCRSPNDLAGALERMLLIAIMPQTAINRLDGNPGYLGPI
jgi:hypothetical protein